MQFLTTVLKTSKAKSASSLGVWLEKCFNVYVKRCFEPLASGPPLAVFSHPSITVRECFLKNDKVSIILSTDPQSRTTGHTLHLWTESYLMICKNYLYYKRYKLRMIFRLFILINSNGIICCDLYLQMQQHFQFKFYLNHFDPFVHKRVNSGFTFITAKMTANIIVKGNTGKICNFGSKKRLEQGCTKKSGNK